MTSWGIQTSDNFFEIRCEARSHSHQIISRYAAAAEPGLILTSNIYIEICCEASLVQTQKIRLRCEPGTGINNQRLEEQFVVHMYGTLKHHTRVFLFTLPR